VAADVAEDGAAVDEVVADLPCPAFAGEAANMTAPANTTASLILQL
jgi:hypothetical protein